MRLADALTNRIDQARIVGWRPGRRVWIEIVNGNATLRMSWLTADGSPMLPINQKDPIVTGSHTVTLDGDLPDGVTCQGWASLPETTDEIDMPTPAEIEEAVKYLRCTLYERHDYEDGRTTYIILGTAWADDRDRLRRCGEALFGGRWQSDLARAVSLGDRRVREWMAGERSIPPSIWTDIAGLLIQRQADISGLIDVLNALPNKPGPR